MGEADFKELKITRYIFIMKSDLDYSEDMGYEI